MAGRVKRSFPGPLSDYAGDMRISTADLARRLAASEPDLVVFDCRHDLGDHAAGAALYAAGHIPGARFAAVETDLSGAKTGANGRHPLPEPAAFAGFLAKQGVTLASRIVAYDQVGGQYAARLWWMARWIGFTNVSVLEGGWPKWVAEGRPVTTTVPPVASPGDVPVQADRAWWLSAEEVQAALEAGTHLVVDARAPARYRGEVEPIDRVAGRIPGAANRFFQDNLNPNLTLRPDAELRTAFETVLAGRPAGEVVHQCGSGITACANLWAMECAGLPGSKLYPGSWSEWSADPARPVARG